MLLLASNVIGQPVLLVPGAQTTALSTKQVQTVHVTGDVASLVQKKMTVSAEEIRWLKVFTKKDDLVQRVKNNESKLARELRLLFAAKQPAVLAVAAETELDSVVIQLSIDAKGMHEVVVYSVAECPAWVAPLVDASAQAADSSWSLAKKLGVTGLVVGISVMPIAVLKGNSRKQMVFNKTKANKTPWAEMTAEKFILPTNYHYNPSEDSRKKSVCQSMASFETVTTEFGRAVAAFQMNGLRYGDDQQDSIAFLRDENWVAFAVFDGHAGNMVSRGLTGESNFLGQLLTKVKEDGKVKQESINLLYKKIDEEIKKAPRYKYFNNSYDCFAGSTAVVFVANIATNQGWFINLGDSSALAVKDGRIILETKDHDLKCLPSCNDTTHDENCEIKRVEDAGSYVISGRIGGSLNVARSFGDFDLKTTYNPSNKDTPVSVIPDIQEFPLTDCDTIFMYSDGVADVYGSTLKSQEIVNFLTEEKYLAYNPAQYLCWRAFQEGSTDNISAIVIDLNAFLGLLTSPETPRR